MRSAPPLALALAAALAACQPLAPRTSPSPAPQALAAALDSIFDDTLFARAHWGVEVRALDTGEAVYRRNAERMFVPASNVKLVTAAAVLATLGPAYRYRTAVAAAGAVAGGELRGDLVVLGSGDPTVGARFGGGDARAMLRAWADSLRAHGISRITGSVVGNDDVFDDVPLGAGWAWDDLDAPYAAEVSGLQLNEGVVEVRVAAGPRAGEPARVTLNPPTGYVPVANAALTAPAGASARVRVTRAPAGPGVVVAGSVRADTTEVSAGVAVRNNTLYFATVLTEVLRDAGIRVEGAPADADDLPPRPIPADTLFVHASPEMRQVLAAFLKPSQNQYGELLLKTLGKELRGTGSAAAGIAVVDSLVRAWGLDARQLSLADGSGLSRYNLAAPGLFVELLAAMARSPRFAEFQAALPVAGVDGTLEGRMRGTPLAGNLRAKTGTLSGVRALSGYFTTASGRPVLFSMLVNHHTLSARDADRLAEAALLRLYHDLR